MDELIVLSRGLGNRLRESGLYLVTAESCTGGLLGHVITEVPGSSDYYLGGFIVYSNEAKERFLGVSPEMLEKYGAVSAECVREMAAGARRAFAGIQPLEKIIAVAVSGIAGPGGGTAEKPVGTVWFGITFRDMEKEFNYLFEGDRLRIKRKSAKQALELLASRLSK